LKSAEFQIAVLCVLVASAFAGYGGQSYGGQQQQSYQAAPAQSYGQQQQSYQSAPAAPMQSYGQSQQSSYGGSSYGGNAQPVAVTRYNHQISGSNSNSVE